jgi:hypothetical protein
MQRVRALLVVGAVLAAARLLPATADTTPPPLPPDPCTASATPSAACEMPRTTCNHAVMTDPSGDATPQYVTNEDTSKVPGMGENSALDIRDVFVRLTPDYLETFLAVDHIPAATGMSAWEGEYRYYVNFKIGPKAVTVVGAQLNPNAPDSASPTDRPGTFPQVQVGAAQAAPAANNAAVGSATQVLLPGTSPDPGWVIVSTSRAQLERALGAPVDPAAVFTDITANTYVVSPNSVGTKSFWTTDWTTQTGTAAQAGASDDWCFGPPPTAINSVSVPAAEYDHTAAMSAVLVDLNGTPIAGKTVTFTVQEGKPTPVSATTDANGVATASYGPIRVAAGSYPVTVAFAGDTTTYKHSSATGTLKVSAAKTLFTALKVTKPTAKTRVVTTTLLDDAKKPVAGARVDWYISGKKVASSTTDKTGKAVFKAGKPGQTVQARYAGKPGVFIATASKSARL